MAPREVVKVADQHKQVGHYLTIYTPPNKVLIFSSRKDFSLTRFVQTHQMEQASPPPGDLDINKIPKL
jgi:hypothetical protein